METKRIRWRAGCSPQRLTLSFAHAANLLGRNTRIGLFIDSRPDSGGGFYQALATTQCLLGSPLIGHEFVVFARDRKTRERLAQLGIGSRAFRSKGVRLLDRWSATVVGGAICRRLRRIGLRRFGRHLDAMLDDHGIDLAFFNECTDSAQRIGDHPFIVTVWDTDHRDHPEFPEVFGGRSFEGQERRLKSVLTRALAVVVNSEDGARRICESYGVDRERVVELPFVPSHHVRRHAMGESEVVVQEVRRKYQLEAPYVFYPAYFSFHKNHLYVLEALRELERAHGIALHAVFCGGGDPGDQENVERQVAALALEDRVHFLGIVPDAEMPALYEGAVALAMPAYYAATNLPPVEAIALGCPVIYPDAPACREWLGDAALYCDLREPASLARQLRVLIDDPLARERIVAAGRRLAKQIADVDYGERMRRTLDDYAYVRRRWAWPA